MSNESTVRVGFIGTGWAERVQIPVFKLGGLTAQAICAAHPENAQRAARKHDIPDVYENWQELIEAPNVDLVSIVTPPSLHQEIAAAALAAGKHVLCEKPMALNESEAETMLAAAQTKPTHLAIVDHELRFTPQRQTIRRLFRENYVGRAIWVELTWQMGHRLDPGGSWNWWSDIEQGGGVLNALGSHLLDLSRWMFGQIDALSAQLKTAHHYRTAADDSQHQVTADDHAHVALKFANGMEGSLTASAIAAGSRGMTFTLYGTDGALRLDEDDRLWGLQGERLKRGEWEEIAVADPAAKLDGLPNSGSTARGTYYLAQAIGRTLSGGESWLSNAASFYDGLRVQQALDAARRSNEERAWVNL